MRLVRRLPVGGGGERCCGTWSWPKWPSSRASVVVHREPPLEFHGTDSTGDKQDGLDSPTVIESVLRFSDARGASNSGP